MANYYSEYKLGQTVWFVTSVYLGFMIADVTKDALIPSIYAETIDLPRMALSITTLTLNFVAAIEAYLWLNPSKEKDIKASTFVFQL